jgi:hypothetical protein
MLLAAPLSVRSRLPDSAAWFNVDRAGLAH